MRNSSSPTIWFPLSIALLSHGPGALAQAEFAEEEAGRPAELIEQVIVTGVRDPLRNTRGAGTRLGLSAFETPASVHQISREHIQVRGDHSTAEAMARAPGFAPVGMQAFAGSALAARGFSGNASIGQLYDGNRLFVSGGAMSFPVDTWGFQRVEVLSGIPVRSTRTASGRSFGRYADTFPCIVSPLATRCCAMMSIFPVRLESH